MGSETNYPHAAPIDHETAPDKSSLTPIIAASRVAVSVSVSFHACALSRAASHAAVSAIVDASGRVARPCAIARCASMRMKPAWSGSVAGNQTRNPTHGSTPWHTSIASSVHAGCGGTDDTATSAATR